MMAELMTREEELAKAETAGYDIPREQRDRLKLVQGQEPDALDKASNRAEFEPTTSRSQGRPAPALVARAPRRHDRFKSALTPAPAA